MTHTTAEIRRFLVDTFNDEELKILCFDYFRDVSDEFTTGMTKGQMIQLLIERCVRREALANLEAALRAERPDQYRQRFGAPAPALIPVETVRAGRDPRQVFISHAHQDADFAHRLAADLASAGWRAWLAPDSIQPGEKWVEAIGRGLDESGVFLVVLTPAAVGSAWVKTETNAAIELEVGGAVCFIPLDAAACAVPVLWNGYQRVSFRGRYEDGLRQLLARLGAAAGPEPAPPVQDNQRAPVDQTGFEASAGAAVDARDRLKPPVQDNQRAAGPSISVPAVAPKHGPIAFDWITIPAGDFVMGSDKAKDKLAYDDETPQHTLTLPEYRIARVPVTVAQFAAFMAANPGYRTTAEKQGSAWSYTGSRWEEVKGADWAHPRGPGSDVRAKQEHPVTCVSWHDALAFCKWAAVRLPTEAEWEKAARGPSTGSGDGRIWPWGNREPNSGVCNFNMTVGDTTPVGRYPDGASPYGLLDAAGNVWEWTSSLFKPYRYDAIDGREDLKSGDGRALRGGSFRGGALFVRCACRLRFDPFNRFDLIGFRVVSPGF